ncbi:MAG: hypothetical protein KA285_03900 [Bacteroidia bacterium]|nr:hypothetical protein [Bacteroidia bacterium]
MRPEFRNFVIMISFLSILSFSCKKENEQQALEFDTQTAQDNALAEGVYSDVNNIANQAIKNGASGLTTYRFRETESSLLSVCATVTITPDSTGTGGIASVDFGSIDCLCLDGHYRRGIINFTYTGQYSDSGTVITTSFDNYYVGKDTTRMFNVTGSKTVTNLGQNTSGNIQFSIAVNGHLTDSDGRIMDWTSTRNREWISGSSTLAWQDDEYLITGSGQGTNFEGNSYTMNITHALDIDFSCAWIKEGVFDLTPTGKATRTFDYGDGTCNNQASITVNGTTFPVTLR